MKAAAAALIGCCAVHLGVVGLIAGGLTGPIFGVAAAVLAGTGAVALAVASRRRVTASCRTPGLEARP